MHSLAPKMGTTSVFIKTLEHWGNEDFWEMLSNEARRAKNRRRKPRAGWDSWGGAVSPTRAYIYNAVVMNTESLREFTRFI